MAKCRFYKKCKLYDKESRVCNITGGMYYDEEDLPAGCYRNEEQNEKNKEM